MTEFQSGMLAIQAASLNLQYISLIGIAGQLAMPIVVWIGIKRMVEANRERAEAGKETQEALKTSVDALRELLIKTRNS